MKGLRVTLRRLRKSERLKGIWMLKTSRNARLKAANVDAEGLRYLDSHAGEEKVGGVDWEILLGDEKNEVNAQGGRYGNAR